MCLRSGMRPSLVGPASCVRPPSHVWGCGFLTIAIDPHSFAWVIVKPHNSCIGFGMSERATALVRHWGARLQENALAARVLVAVHERATPALHARRIAARKPGFPTRRQRAVPKRGCRALP